MKMMVVCMFYRDRAPNQRFRIEQYIDFLEKNGVQVDFANLIDKGEDKILYSPGNYIAKAILMAKKYMRRWKQSGKAAEYDVIMIVREAFMLGNTTFEKRFYDRNKNIIFDFDDSIWLQNVSEGNKKLAFLKNANKTSDIIKLSKLIFAGNPYLKDYASNYNNNIVIIPTTIDTEEYSPLPKKANDKVVIGWSGSITTIEHFKTAVPFLIKIKEKYGDRVAIKVVGDANYVNKELDVQGTGWNKATELEDLCSMDIGIMPLPDDDWSKGKCGLKGLQYMALEIPTIMSPVGVNSDIIQDGQNGFLATEVDEWVEKLSKLIDSAELRNKLGKAGRQTIIDKYSVTSQRQRYLDYITALPKQ